MSVVVRDRAECVLDDLATARPIRIPAVMVVAHPDDETLAMGGRLPVFENLTLVQLTDGSPRSTDDARRAGLPTRRAYAAMRECEVVLALARLGLRSCERIRYGVSDQDAVLHLGDLADRLRRDLNGADIIFTHPYEGGHPDHDAAALLVQSVCDAMRRAAQVAPLRLEFTSYHCRDGAMATGRFWPDPAFPEVVAPLSNEAARRKREALACHRSQSEIIARFDIAPERYRLAPRYNFSRPPPPGAALYDLFGWPMNSRSWRHHARAAWLSLAGEPA